MAAPVVTLHPSTPPVPGVREVLNADFPAGVHDYPMHAHDTWTVLLLDRGAVRYSLEGRERFAVAGEITLLPPRVPHDGAAATRAGFRKRVLYLEAHCLPAPVAAASTRGPARRSDALTHHLAALHGEVARAADWLAAEQRLVQVVDAIVAAWTPGAAAQRPERAGAAGLAGRLKELLDADIAAAVTLQEAADLLGATRSALVHSFGRRFGMSPHRYVVSRRLDAARALLLHGVPAAQVAVAAGFHDQAHLSRHFRRLLGVPPGAWASAAAGRA